MSTYRRPKAVTTDFRKPAHPPPDPPRVKRGFPLERETARPGAVASPDCWERRNSSQQREAAEHDRWVADQALWVVEASAKDLGARRPWDMKDPEHRWLMGRKAAILRRLLRERQNITGSAA